MSEKETLNIGGAAAHTGITYQDRVAAWLCVWILAEQEASSLWDWSSDTTLEFLRCETEQPIDDIMVGTSQKGFAYINVKHSVNASQSKDSPLASFLEQAVRQFIVSRNQTKGTPDWERPLDLNLDRFVLITSLNSSTRITKDLITVLERVRDTVTKHVTDGVAKTKSEREVLEKVSRHLERLWAEFTATKLSEDNFFDLLNLIRIQVLDVDDAGNHEREAKDRLRASILNDPSQANIAWNTLLKICSIFASRSSGGSRRHLQEQLLKAGIVLKSPRSFQRDIDRLKEHSDRIFNLLRPLSLIEMGEKEIKINRPVSLSLREAAEQKSLVVVGEPGSGKSGVLHDVVNQLRQEGRDVIFLAVDRIEAKSLSNVQQELRLDHDLYKVLCNWPGTQPSFLVIDALDGARSPEKAQAFYDLMQLVINEATRWRVVASIRQYDLRHNTKLRSLFKGHPSSTFRSSEFFLLSHINVPQLGEEEWQQIADQSPELGTLIDVADSKLKELLLVPFNVKLMAELLDQGIAIEQLTPIRTQIELLDLYWAKRVNTPIEQKDARESLLLRAVEEMVKDRSLRVNRRLVATESADSPIFAHILSDNILSQWKRNPDGPVEDGILTFAHHVLFDYAVAKLYLRGTPQSLLEKLENDPELTIAIRPSLIMHFEHERRQDLNDFWEGVFNILSSERIPEIGKLIGPSVAVESAASLEDFSPLIRAITSTDPTKREVAEKAFRHVAGALMLKSNELIVGPVALNWSELLDRCSSDPNEKTLYPCRPVLHSICDTRERMTDVQRQAAGIVARRLLHFALTQPNRDIGLVISGLQTVCRTYESDIVASREILRRCLVPEHVLQYGHEELFRLGNEVDYLVTIDPVIVEEIYKAAFIDRDNSDETTPIDVSRIMPMVSTRRQDFQMGRWVLAQKYNPFLKSSSIHALRALITAIDAYSKERTSRWYVEPEISKWSVGIEYEESFDFNGQQAFIKPDQSEMWDSAGAYRNDEPVEMLREFQNYLESISDISEKDNERLQLINLIVKENCTAAIWRRLLKAAINHPSTLGFQIRPLCWSIPILVGFDTTQPIGELLKRIFHDLTIDERERIERAILSIAESADEERRNSAERKRNRLLGCLDVESLVTDEAKDLMARLKESDTIPSNEQPYDEPTFSSRILTTEENLRMEGVPVEEETNRRIVSLMDPAKVFASRFSNASPTLAETRAVIPGLRSLYTSLQEALAKGAHQHTVDYGWGYLTDACESAVRSEGFDCELEDSEFIKSVLIEAAAYDDPRPTQDHSSFDRHQGWGSPSARIDAATGVMNLASKASCVDEKLLETIESLSNDPVRPVRFQITIRLVSLYYTAPKLMWRLLERISREDESRGVLNGLLYGSLDRLAAYHADQISELVGVIFKRVREGDGADDVRKRCASIFAGLYIWQGHQPSYGFVQTIARDPAIYRPEAHEIIGNLRNWLNVGLTNLQNKEQEQVRNRSFDLMKQILESTLKQTRELEAEYTKHSSQWNDSDQDKARSFIQLADSICMQLYFASGAYRDNESNDKVPRGAQERKNFWSQARPILELLSEYEYPKVTHHLLKTLAYLLPFDPPEVFLLIGSVVRNGKQGGYQYESLAIDLVVSIVERFIAEYAYVLQERIECRNILIEILDTFVDAGWASARRLTYRMEEIFR